MNNATRRPGATLPELLLLLSLLAVLGGMSVSVSARARDRIAAHGARDVVASAIGRARALARMHGSARVHVDVASGALRIEAPVGSPRGGPTLLRDAFGVQVSVDGATSAPVVLDFDALGLGRLANRTLRFRRNDAEARLTLSSYGRPRRW
jgi:type II secretory pathway pseudopilin PulG